MEDLINSPHFNAFGLWLRERELPSAGALGPRALGSACVMAQRAVPQTRALLPISVMPCRPSYHVGRLQSAECPLDWEAVVDHDVQFAASSITTDLARLRTLRADALDLVKELSRRLWPVSQRLRVAQHPDVRSVNCNVHLALFAVCVGRRASCTASRLWGTSRHAGCGRASLLPFALCKMVSVRAGVMPRK